MLLRLEGLWMLGKIERFRRVELGMEGRFERVEYGVKGRFERVELGIKERWEELLHCWNLELGIELSNWMEVGGERKCWIGSLAEVVWVVRGLSFFFVLFLTVL